MINDIIINLKNTRNHFQNKINKIESNIHKSNYTYPQIQINKLRNELATYEYFIDQQFTKFVSKVNSKLKQTLKEKSTEFIKENIINNPYNHEDVKWTSFDDIKKYIKDLLITAKNNSDIIDKNQLIQLQMDNNEQKSNEKLDIIIRFKINYIEKSWFKTSDRFKEKPIFNFKFIKFNKDNIHIKHKIIELHGNNSDKLLLPSYNKNHPYYKHQKQYF